MASIISDKGVKKPVIIAKNMMIGAAIKKTNPVHAEYKGEDTTIYYTASFGMYYFKTNDKLNIKQAYIHADDLLLESKRLGRNQVTVMEDKGVSVERTTEAMKGYKI